MLWCSYLFIFLQVCPSTILHLGQNKHPGFKGSADVDVLLQICMRFRSSFFKEHSTPSHVSLHIKDQNSMREHLSCVTRHDMLCESICQGAAVPLITRLQTPSSDLHTSSAQHSAQAPGPRAGEASQAFVLTAAAWPSAGEAVSECTANTTVALQCTTPQ